MPNELLHYPLTMTETERDVLMSALEFAIHEGMDHENGPSGKLVKKLDGIIPHMKKD